MRSEPIVAALAVAFAWGCGSHARVDSGETADPAQDGDDESTETPSTDGGEDSDTHGDGDGDGEGNGDGDGEGDGAGPTCGEARLAPLTEGCVEQQEDSYAFPCGEEVTLLAIAAHAKDDPPQGTREEVFAYLNEDNYLGLYSVAQRIAMQSNGQVRIKFLLEYVTLPGNLVDYDESEGQDHPRDFDTDALEEVIARGFDFSQLSSTDPHHDDWKYPYTILNLGEFIDYNHCGAYQLSNGDYGYASMSYFNSGDDVGVMIHELGHCLFGWGEFYAEDPGIGTGAWDPMAYGFDMPYNPFIRSCKQWVSVYDIADYPAGTVFDIPSDANVVLRYRTSRRHEYFLIQAIQKSTVLPTVPDEGLLIWHVDETMQYQHGANTSAEHYRVALEQADGKFEMESGEDEGSEGDAFKAGYAEAFGGATTPSSAFYDGTSSGLEVSQISGVGERMTFVLGPPGTEPIASPVAFDDCTSCP